MKSTLYRVPEILTLGYFLDAREFDLHYVRRRFVMSAPIPLRRRFWCVPAAWFGEEDEDGLRRADFWLWRRSTTVPRGRKRRGSAVTVQIVRDWVIKFNARGPDGLVDRKAPGSRPG